MASPDSRWKMTPGVNEYVLDYGNGLILQLIPGVAGTGRYALYNTKDPRADIALIEGDLYSEIAGVRALQIAAENIVIKACRGAAPNEQLKQEYGRST